MTPDMNPSNPISLQPPPYSNPMGDTQYPSLAQTGYPGMTPGFPAQDAQNPNTPTLGGLMSAFRRRWFIATVSGLFAALIVLAGTYVIMPPQYAAEIRFNVAAQHAPTPGVEVHAQIEFPVYKAGLERLIRTPVLLASALQEKVSHDRAAADLPTIRAWGADAVGQLEGRLKTDFFLGPELLRVSFTGKNPEDLADILNAVGSAFLNQVHQNERMPIKARIDQYRNQESKLIDELNNLQRQLAELLRTSKNPGQARETQQFTQFANRDRLREIQSELGKVARELSEKNDESELAKENLSVLNSKDPPKKDLRKILFEDPEIVTIRKRIASLHAELDLLEATVAAANFPAVAEPRLREIETHERKILAKEKILWPELVEAYRRPIREDLEAKIAVATRSITRLKGQKAELEKTRDALEVEIRNNQLGSINEPPEITNMKAKVDAKTTAIDDIRKLAHKLEGEKFISRVSLNSPAQTPSSLDYSRFLKLGASGALATFFLVVALVSLVEFMNHKISDPSQVSRGLGLPILGTVPAAPKKLRRNPDQPPSEKELLWQHQVNEAIDGVRTILIHANRKEPTRVVMVTSANSGEGKTTLASQLAASLSRAWKKVLLIDGDLRNPGCHQLFEVPHEPGLSEVLRNEIPAGDAVRGTPISRLWVLPAGNWDNHAIQSLSQEDVRKIIDQLKESYDFIIVDSCPVLPVNDTLLLAQHMDGVIFSVLRDVSRMPEVQAARQRLQPLNIRTLGAVLVGVKSEANPAYNYVNSRGGNPQ